MRIILHLSLLAQMHPMMGISFLSGIVFIFKIIEVQHSMGLTTTFMDVFRTS